MPRGSSFHALANPARFLRLANAVLPFAKALAAAALAAGLVLGLYVAPPDYQQGEAYRIMFVHVPSAWMALLLYALIALLSAAFLIWKHPLAAMLARAAAPVGATFTLINLVSGALWGKPMWGAYWVWDARLTSMLILFFLYLGYIALTEAFEAPERGAKAGAVLALVGAINLPIIKFSVDWWNTLHQPASISKLDAPSIDPSMLPPLLLMAVGFTAYAAAVVIYRVKADLMERRIRALSLARTRR